MHVIGTLLYLFYNSMRSLRLLRVIITIAVVLSVLGGYSISMLATKDSAKRVAVATQATPKDNSDGTVLIKRSKKSGTAANGKWTQRIFWPVRAAIILPIRFALINGH